MGEIQINRGWQRKELGTVSKRNKDLCWREGNERMEKKRKESMNARAAGRRNPVILLLLPCWLDIFSIRPPPLLYLQGDTFIFLAESAIQIRHIFLCHATGMIPMSSL